MSELERRRGLARRLATPIFLGLTLSGVGLLAPESFVTDFIAAACVTGLWVLSWIAFCGPTQELNFGQAFFVGTAAYLAALVQTRLGWSPWTALLLGMLAGGALGLGVAALTFRHRGLYFSMITMALQLAFYRSLFLSSSWLGGEEGLFGVRSLAGSRIALYWISAGLLVVASLTVEEFFRSRTGLLLGATGQDESLALGLGANIFRLRSQGLALSGALAGLGGALYVLTQGQANTELASDQLSIRVLLLGIAGGLWSLPGSLVSVFALQTVQASLFGQLRYDALVYTGLLLAIVLLLPRGLVPLRPRWSARQTPRRHAGSVAASTRGLELRGIELRFGGLRALQGIDLDLLRGRSIGLIGPNGAGKTTLLNVIAGQRMQDTGEVRWGGRDLLALDTSARARLGVRKTHQHVVSFPALTLEEHLAVARAASGVSAEGPELQSLLAACGGPAVLGVPVSQLPPAVARMAEVAMALAAPPGLLLLDEPFAALSGREVEAVCAAIQALQRRGVAMIIVEHRLHELFRLVEEIVVLDRGAVLARRPSNEVLQDPQVLAAYGVRAKQEAAG